MFVTVYRSQSISPHSCTYRHCTSNTTYSCHYMPHKVSENVLYPGNTRKYANHYTSVWTVLMLYLMPLKYCTLAEVFLNLTEVFLTLTQVFPCFFLSCKANARVKLAKTGHSPHSYTLVVICVVRLLFGLFYVLFVCKCVLPLGDNPIAVNKYIIYLMFLTKTNFVCNLFPTSIGCSSCNFSALYGNNLARNINTQYYLLRHALITSRRHNYKT
jgi:hypothetical protein